MRKYYMDFWGALLTAVVGTPIVRWIGDGAPQFSWTTFMLIFIAAGVGRIIVRIRRERE